jgi:hypothetical protein
VVEFHFQLQLNTWLSQVEVEVDPAQEEEEALADLEIQLYRFQ